VIPASSSFQVDCGALFVVFPIYDLLYNMGTSNLFLFLYFLFCVKRFAGGTHTLNTLKCFLRK
jgi:hypothetical protein